MSDHPASQAAVRGDQRGAAFADLRHQAADQQGADRDLPEYVMAAGDPAGALAFAEDGLVAVPRDLDAEANGALLFSPATCLRYGDAAFQPCFETCEDHGSFIDVTFLLGDDGFCIEVLIPSTADREVIDLFAPHVVPAQEVTP